jgi:hypothetical protein
MLMTTKLQRTQSLFFTRYFLFFCVLCDFVVNKKR